MYGLSDEIIQSLREVFREQPNVREVILFGSRAKGNYTTGSDIDLAVRADNLSFRQLMDIHARIEDLELLYKVDVINYDKVAGTPIGEHIDRVGRILYQRDVLADSPKIFGE